jgi:hypothetical protein
MKPHLISVMVTVSLVVGIGCGGATSGSDLAPPDADASGKKQVRR